MMWELPVSAEIDGVRHPIRTDFRVILEIIQMLSDADLSDEDKAEGILQMFYLRPEEIRNYREAVNQCFRFIDGGHGVRTGKKSPRLVDWEQDSEYIIAPVNRVLGYEARAIAYNRETNEGGLHWWTFLVAYMEIGANCTFSQIVAIRDKRARGKKLEKWEREWYQRNADIIELHTKYSDSENELIKAWTQGR